MGRIYHAKKQFSKKCMENERKISCEKNNFAILHENENVAGDIT